MANRQKTALVLTAKMPDDAEISLSIEGPGGRRLSMDEVYNAANHFRALITRGARPYQLARTADEGWLQYYGEGLSRCLAVVRLERRLMAIMESMLWDMWEETIYNRLLTYPAALSACLSLLSPLGWYSLECWERYAAMEDELYTFSRTGEQAPIYEAARHATWILGHLAAWEAERRYEFETEGVFRLAEPADGPDAPW